MRVSDPATAPLTLRRMVVRSLRFHARSHLGVVLGAAVGSAALIGALVVGDSVRGSLREQAEARLGATAVALDSGDRLFTDSLAATRAIPPTRERPDAPGRQFSWGAWSYFGDGPWTASALHLRGTVGRQDGTARAHSIHLLGVTSNFWAFSPRATRLRRVDRLFDSAPLSAADRDAALRELESWQRPARGKVRLGEALARQLNAAPGDALVFRFPKPTGLSPDAVLGSRDDATVALRLVVDDVVGPEAYGDFSLRSGQGRALNAFVHLEELWEATGLTNRYNLLLAQSGHWVGGAAGWRERWRRTLASSRWVPDFVVRLLGRESDGSYGSTALTAATLEHLNVALERRWQLDDAQIQVRVVGSDGGRSAAEGSEASVEVTTSRVFLSQPVVAAATRPDPALPEADRVERGWMTNGAVILTYLANSLRAGDRLTPYSMVAAAGPPWTPQDLADDEIVINDWLAHDLGVTAGDTIELAYFDPEAGARLVERTRPFRVRVVVPLQGVHADRSLMPEFPGLADAESTRDWDAGFPLVHRIRDQDEEYWKVHRGTPKAFVSPSAGRQLWANRFGEATAVRHRVPPGVVPEAFRRQVAANLWANLEPTDVGLAFQPVLEQARRGATSGQDFGGLFIGFSLFLVAAALILMALLFQFGLEQRLPEVGTLLGIGFRASTVRRLWLGEALALAMVGGLVGVVGGCLYARAMIHGLTTIWRDAVAGAILGFHVTPASVVGGWLVSVAVCGATLWLALRRHFARPIRELLAGELGRTSGRGQSRGTWWVGWVLLTTGVSTAAWSVASGHSANPGAFFGAGSLVLIGGMCLLAGWLAWRGGTDGSRVPSVGPAWTVPALAVRGTARRRSRSLATAGLLAGGTFVVTSLGVFRLDAHRDSWLRTSGTGGFALIAESALPIVQDLNTPAGLEAYGLSPEDVPGVRFVPFRVRDGDDASCLNLNRAQRPRILGVESGQLTERGAFLFARLAKGLSVTNGWQALLPAGAGGRDEASEDGSGPARTIPAIGDSASIQWALGRSVGDVLELGDEAGRPMGLRLVGGLANSVLQGSLVIEESAFQRLFPGEAGYRYFLIDAPSARVAEVSATLSRALEDVGLQVTPAARRLAEFNAVQNTYLGTFQVLGGLGLLLGSAGLGVVVLRNVLERRGELALMTAVGFRQSTVARLVLLEHAALLACGLGLGVISAAIAVLPSVLGPAVALPWQSLLGTVLGVAGLGLATAWVATQTSLRGRLLDALRGE